MENFNGVQPVVKGRSTEINGHHIHQHKQKAHQHASSLPAKLYLELGGRGLSGLGCNLEGCVALEQFGLAFVTLNLCNVLVLF